MLEVYYEDREVIVVNKPAGVQSQASAAFSDDMVSLIKKHLLEGGAPAGTEPYVGVVHRLDTNVAGVMVYAKTKEAAAALSRQVQEGNIGKQYQAVVLGIPKEKSGTWTDWLRQEKKENVSVISNAKDKEAKKAELRYRLLGKKYLNGEQLSLLGIELVTGRHHQIRVQCASRNMPVLGDVKYGSRKADRLYLVSSELSFTHPKTRKQMHFTGPQLSLDMLS